MNNGIEKFQITACTLIYPYLDKGVGRFVEWYKSDLAKPEFSTVAP